jgi:hypothetical protein
MDAGYVETISGGTTPVQPISNTPPRYDDLQGVAYDTVRGYLWVCDYTHSVIRRISPDGNNCYFYFSVIFVM